MQVLCIYAEREDTLKRLYVRIPPRPPTNYPPTRSDIHPVILLGLHIYKHTGNPHTQDIRRFIITVVLAHFSRIYVYIFITEIYVSTRQPYREPTGDVWYLEAEAHRLFPPPRARIKSPTIPRPETRNHQALYFNAKVQSEADVPSDCFDKPRQ